MKVNINYAMQFANIHEFYAQCVQLFENGDISELSSRIEHPVEKHCSHHFVTVNSETFGNKLWEEYSPFILEIASTMTVNQRQIMQNRDGVIEIHGTLPEKTGSESVKIKNSDAYGQTCDMEIEQYAEELFNIFHEGDDSRSYDRLQDKSGFRAMARHFATPSTEVQKQLQDALTSERELMGYFREIGKVFNVYVGVDIGIQDLPKLVREQMEMKKEQSDHCDNLIKQGTTLNRLLTQLIVQKLGVVHPRPGKQWSDDMIIKHLNKLELPQPLPERCVMLLMSHGLLDELGFPYNAKPENIATTLVKRHNRAKEVEENFKALSEKVAETYTHIGFEE